MALFAAVAAALLGTAPVALPAEESTEAPETQTPSVAPVANQPEEAKPALSTGARLPLEALGAAAAGPTVAAGALLVAVACNFTGFYSGGGPPCGALSIPIGVAGLGVTAGALFIGPAVGATVVGKLAGANGSFGGSVVGTLAGVAVSTGTLVVLAKSRLASWETVIPAIVLPVSLGAALGYEFPLLVKGSANTSQTSVSVGAFPMAKGGGGLALAGTF